MAAGEGAGDCAASAAGGVPLPGSVGAALRREGLHGHRDHRRQAPWPPPGIEIQVGTDGRRCRARHVRLPHGAHPDPNVQRERGPLSIASTSLRLFTFLDARVSNLLNFQVYQLSIGAACGLSWPSDRIIIQVLDDSTDESIKVADQIDSLNFLLIFLKYTQIPPKNFLQNSPSRTPEDN